MAKCFPVDIIFFEPYNNLVGSVDVFPFFTGKPDSVVRFGSQNGSVAQIGYKSHCGLIPSPGSSMEEPFIFVV